MKYMIALFAGNGYVAGEKVLFMGELENMEGHCCVLLSSGKIAHGMHTDNFYSFHDDHYYSEGSDTGFQLSDMLTYCKEHTNGFWYLKPELLKLLVEMDQKYPDSSMSERMFVLAAAQLEYETA